MIWGETPPIFLETSMWKKHVIRKDSKNYHADLDEKWNLKNVFFLLKKHGSLDDTFDTNRWTQIWNLKMIWQNVPPAVLFPGSMQ